MYSETILQIIHKHITKLRVFFNMYNYKEIKQFSKLFQTIKVFVLTSKAIPPLV